MNLAGDFVHGGAPACGDQMRRPNVATKVASPQRTAAPVAIFIVACLRELSLHVQCTSTHCNGAAAAILEAANRG
jgi:hypothetical protein